MRYCPQGYSSNSLTAGENNRSSMNSGSRYCGKLRDILPVRKAQPAGVGEMFDVATLDHGGDGEGRAVSFNGARL